VAVQALLEKLFVVSGLHPFPDLHIVLPICAAAMVMYHRLVTEEFGSSNSVATKLRNSARSASISDARYPNMSPESLLDEWSDIIMDDYKARNSEITESSPDLVQIATVQNQQTAVLIELKTALSDMKRENEHDHLHMTTQGVTISEQHDTIATLRDELQKTRARLALDSTVATLQNDLHSARAELESARTPPGLASSTASSQHAQVASDCPSKSPKVTESDCPSCQDCAAPRELVYGAEARA
jgi:hypothetical protein